MSFSDFKFDDVSGILIGVSQWVQVEESARRILEVEEQYVVAMVILLLPNVKYHLERTCQNISLLLALLFTA